MNRRRSADSLDNDDDWHDNNSSTSSSPKNLTPDVGRTFCNVPENSRLQKRAYKQTNIFNYENSNQEYGHRDDNFEDGGDNLNGTHPIFERVLDDILNKYGLGKKELPAPRHPEAEAPGENISYNWPSFEKNPDEFAHGEIYPALSNPLRPVGLINSPQNMVLRMCARLVECRDLEEAVDFVNENRELIEDLTRVVVEDAPAFRDYDFSQYQIDQTIKDSFNPNFWLDREPVVTTADGNCQYHAVSISLTGTEEHSSSVRLAAAVAVVDHRDWFDSILKLVDGGSVLDLVQTIARNYSWGDETTLKAIAIAIKRRIFLYTCNIGKKDYELVKSLSRDELVNAFIENKYRGGTGIHAYADPLVPVDPNNYIMLFHKSEHFIAVLPTCPQVTMFEPYNPIVPVFN